MKRLVFGKSKFCIMLAIAATSLTLTILELRPTIEKGRAQSKTNGVLKLRRHRQPIDNQGQPTISIRQPSGSTLALINQTIRSTTKTLSTLPICSETPESLLGRISVDLTPLLDVALENLQVNSSGIQFGGWWRPRHCNPRVKVAILIPYRNRLEQLKIFLRHMIPILERQLLSYRIFVIEQVGKTAFNKGAIYNIGFNATLSFDDYDCYIFHDVDLLAENDLNYYGCPTSPRHMSAAVDRFKYKLPYPFLVGGIQAFTKEHYILVNGYSNKYWGWGGEDDDLSKRITYSGLALTRPAFAIGRYKMNVKNHFRSDIWNPENAKLFKSFAAEDRNKEGLNTIGSLKKTMQIYETRLYTVVSINLSKS